MADRTPVDVFAARLGDPNLEIKLKVSIAAELRDSIDIFQGQTYPTFLAKLMPIFMQLLQSKPVFISTSAEQKLRNCILDIIHRLPFNPPEALEPYAPDLVDLLMGLVQIENEDNAVLCMKTIMDYQRQHTKVLADRVQPFLDLIKEMFQQMPQAVKDAFDNPVQGATPGMPSTPGNVANFQSPRPGSPMALTTDVGGEQQTTRPLLKGMQSFKVLSECPIIVVSVFQAHRHCVHKNVKDFVPCIKEVLLLQAGPQQREHQNARTHNTIFTGVSPNIKNRAAFGDFITAQVKTMSFLAYLLRVYAQQLSDFLPTLPEIVVRLLKDCPRERSGARKELLVAIRHIINFNFRKIFLKKIDDLLDDRVLIGDGLTVYETMRPLAYSMLADLIHHVRDALSRDQIRRTVEVYTKNLHDSFPGTSFQTMSAKLLLNMADCIAKLPNKADARHFLIMILDAIAEKFAAMRRQYHNAVKLTKQYAQHTIDAIPENCLADKEKPPDWDEIDIFDAKPICTSSPRDRGADPVADNKFLFKNLMNGLKSMLYALKLCNPLPQPVDTTNMPLNWGDVAYGFNAEEVKIIIKLFREGAHVFRYYSLEMPPTESTYSSPVEFLANHYMVSSGKEEKDLLETFATVFHCVDPATFHEVFQSEIPRLYEMIFEHTALLHVPQFFLASEATSPSFCGMLLQFLMDHIHEVGTKDVRKSSVLLRLFKLSFMAVTLFCTQNEQVLLPHLSKIVIKSLHLSTTAEEPMNYFLLLRSLFRSIGGGKFEHLYKEILPLLEMLLEVLNNLLMSARKPQERDLYVELCLTVPARLSNLLPHLSYLMRPLVVALRAGSDLVGQGLRTLELCVDNLTADYLDPIMAPVIDDLMTALWDHLKPAPYSHFHAHTTMRILGKLGGRNRKFLTDPPSLDFKQYADDQCSIDVKLIGSPKERPFPAEIGIDLAIGKLMEIPKTPAAKKSDGFYKQQALRLLSSQLKLFIGYDSLPDDFAQLVRLQATDLLDGNLEPGTSFMEKSERDKSVAKKNDQEQTLRKLLKACIFAISIPDLKEEASSLVFDVCRHFTILEVGRALAVAKHLKKPFAVNSGEGPLFLDTRILGDAIVDCLSSEISQVRDAAEECIKTIRDAAVVIFGKTPDKVERLPFFVHLAKMFCHSCHEEEWFTKAGGSLGIHILTTRIHISDAWLFDRHVEFVRALVYVMKDMPQDLPATTRIRALETLEALLRKCNKNVSKDDLASPQSRLYNVCGFIIYELSHMNRHVRESSQKALAIIAETIKTEVYELMAPVKERLLQPIYNKPLRALPFATQIGYIDAITFCLGLQHDIVEFNDQLNRLLMETLALADAEDDALAAKHSEQRTAESIVNLRVACIRLLSMAMGFSEFGNSPQNQTRARIIAVFFRCLYSKSTDVIDAAYAGLKGVLAQTNKLPKDLLQNGLRPILMNLSDPKRINVAGLEGLARLLTLLTNYFKVEIGARLLDHLKTFAEPNSLQQISFKLLEQNPQMKIIAAILNIFHLLPPAAVTFMEGLVNTVLDLEEKLRRTHYSPFREPLLKYINRYPKESWAFFSIKLQDMRYGRFFAQLIGDEASGPLRAIVMSDIEGLTRNFSGLQASELEQHTATVNAVRVVYSICMNPTTSEWLVSQNDLREKLLHAGKDLEGKLRADTLPQVLRLAVEQVGEQLMDIFTKAYLSKVNQLDFLFEIIDAVTADQIKYSYALRKHIYDHIICSSSMEYQRTIVIRSLDLYAGKNVTQQTKTFAFRFLVNPILAMDIMKSMKDPKCPKLMDKGMTEAIHNKIWKPNLGDLGDDPGQAGVDHSRLELLQMSAMLIKHHHHLLQDARKDVIKFGWNYIKLEDIINKHAAYVLIGYFIAHYETPSKIVVQIYVALLRAHQNEGRSLVTQALELIAPFLPKRVASSGDARYPIWAKWPRRILAEEGHNLQQLTSILHFMVRHHELFYESREHFVPWVIGSLSKIAPHPNPSNENKKLSLNLVSLIWQWEQRRVKGPQAPSESPQSRKRKLDTLTGSSSSPPLNQSTSAAPERSEYIVPESLKIAVIGYLVRFITSLPERYGGIPTTPPQTPQPVKMCKKSLQLLYDLLTPEYWGDLDKVDLFTKVTESLLTGEVKMSQQSVNQQNDKPDEKYVTSVVNTLQVLRIIINMKPDEWIIANLPQLQKLLEKPLRSELPEIQDCLHNASEEQDDGRKLKPFVKRILDAVPEEAPEEEDADVEAPTSEFVTFLSAVATETLSAGNHISSINILWTLAQRRPSEMDSHIPLVMKALSQKLARDHVAAYSIVSGQPAVPQTAKTAEPAPGIPDQRELEIQTDLILKTIDLIALRMSVLGDQRRPFLSVLASLVEKSQSTTLCTKILDMVESWVFKSTEPFPTLKEKTAVLHKMLLFEARPDQTLLTKFLELVIRIYEDPQITRTELTVRLEHAFLVGTRAQDVEMRNRFMAIFDRSITRTASARLNYVLTSQNWDTLADSFWLSQASQLIFGSVEMNSLAQLDSEDFKTFPASTLFGTYSEDQRKGDLMLDDKFEDFMASHRKFCTELGDVKVRDMFEPLSQLQHLDPQVAHQVWINFFPLCWSALSKEERLDLERGMLSLLTKDYHQRQVDKRPNVVQTLLDGISKASPVFKIPPHVVKFLSRTYDVWYTAAFSLEQSALHPTINSTAVRESNMDALTEIYATLGEDDLYYGLWRRRCAFIETNAALSFEQHGMWDSAQRMYEQAQIKARLGTIPFSQAEYMLWEDHWVTCAQKLQQWEILSDFAKHENFNDLTLECVWRDFTQWTSSENREQLDSIIKSLMDAPTPRRTFFQAFMSLLKLHAKTEAPADFGKVCDESIQLSLRKWHQLPNRITNAHIPLLQNFQQLVELHDASLICASLSQTNQANLDTKSQELKQLLTTWRDRLPNVWDDINAWQDLVTWRQHIFNLINTTYIPLLPPQQGNATGNSYAYRGYHETAWIINRFAHVARKHQLPEVCISQLSRIYTLPNIEIQEAFLKLREQAKCHYQNPNELNQGLDVINNTNLNYFGAQQKAEFFTLKGMFLAKLNHKEEANEAFGTALYYDLKLPKAWAEWGYYSDGLFKENPSDTNPASNAVSCYLEASGLYKNAKSRKLLSRILWLLSLDDSEGKISKSFEGYKGETPVWYWITFIPQLLTSLSYGEANIARSLLVKIAKTYPQSLYYLLRTSREESITSKKQQEQKQEKARAKQDSPANKQGSPNVNQAAPNGRPESAPRPGTSGGDPDKTAIQNGNRKTLSTFVNQIVNYELTDAGSPQTTNEKNQSPANGKSQDSQQQAVKKQPWDYTEDIMSVLKTAFPLLALSMETMVDQIQKHFKCPPDEDAYRLIVALLNDGLSYVGRMPVAFAEDSKLPPATEANITRFAETILPAHIRSAFEEEFVAVKPNLYSYIQKLRRWRDRFEEKLDRRPSHQSLENYSPHLSEFRFQKFDEVEVPGQYLQHKDKNQDFIRIERFLPDVDLVRGIGICHRRLKIRGHDGSIHPFAIQHPAARHCRREERILQLFRIFNGVLAKRKESRRRNLNFHLPLMVPLAPHIRLVQDNASYITLQGIYEDYCRRVGMNKDDPILLTMKKLRKLTDIRGQVIGPELFQKFAMADMGTQKYTDQSTNMRMEAFTAIQDTMVPNSIVLDYFTKSFTSFTEFWLFRRQFSYQFAALTFMTYIMHMNNRYPHKLSIARGTGNIWGSELIPAMAAGKAFFHNPEPVPFRLSPNIQTLMGPIAMEGIFSCAVMAIARCLTEPEFELEQQLSIFVRDEMNFWYRQQHRSGQQESQSKLRESVAMNSEIIVKKAVSLARPPEGNLPASQTVIDLISRAVNPMNLAQSDALWMPYL
ncbi:hypothetical protein FGG08_000060 [Glutinoglossum americanum]|uniref:Non-specific serine/threonine protein kinase n=1 Tax=Glutinoglossum americanum TaxID=1670608 RepID=A0A9P8L6B7_9PEZI|nr:hypothetical protein FGG08_000060 [Glutinoglossum americanum]